MSSHFASESHLLICHGMRSSQPPASCSDKEYPHTYYFYNHLVFTVHTLDIIRWSNSQFYSRATIPNLLVNSSCIVILASLGMVRRLLCPIDLGCIPIVMVLTLTTWGSGGRILSGERTLHFAGDTHCIYRK